ncbi:DUF1653 domain-containing protein [uncultured Acetatifactor sp.]|uniref:DUF1653 domain-containing protein n=1 Tax=uncultured Acetatifactor sp. TaxID=1671927 RepID=UPI0026196A08|nr:DUF1653 domain-containing protein [uncultured Acetatifactor sp.]MCI9574373.1 DUF1653 domain-containing protein [Lachnospiraceae bacterium]
MSFIPRPQEIYKHFKGNLYQVTAIATHSETQEQLVIYQALYGDFRIYARPLDMFVSRVDREKYPDVGQEFRFELQGPGAERQRAESEPEPGDCVAGGIGTEPEHVAGGIGAEPGYVAGGTGTAAGVEEWADAEEASGAESAAEALDPFVMEFLDADSYEQRLNILAGLHHRITDGMITTMAIACDIEIDDGDTEERYEALKTCLQTLERYECNRLR